MTDAASIRDRISLVRARLDAIPALYVHGQDINTTRGANSAAMQALVQDLVALGATITVHPGHTAVKMLGLRSTSTSGVTGALRNWCNAAEGRLHARDGRS